MRAYQAALGQTIPYAAPSRYAVSSDAGPMFEFGVRALTFGPGGVSTGDQFTVYDPRHQQSEVLGIENLTNAARVYALAALELCGGR